MQLDFARAARNGVELGPAERAALIEIVIGGKNPNRTPIGQRIWVSLGSLAGRHEPAISHLITLEVVAWWERDAMGNPLERGPYLSLTPWGAAILGVEPIEQIDSYPRWAKAEDPEDDSPPRWGGVRMPMSVREYGMKSPELAEDTTPPAGPEYLADEWSGLPVELFPDWTGRGVPVQIDRRLKVKRKKGRRKAG